MSELGLYHYRFIHKLQEILTSEIDINTKITEVFNAICIEIKPSYALFLLAENKNLNLFLSYATDIEKIKNIKWDDDDIIKYTINTSKPISIKNIAISKIKFSTLFLSGLGYRFSSVISFPLIYKNNLYGIMSFFKNTEFSENEFEMISIISKQLTYQIAIEKSKEESDHKCHYFKILLENISSGIIIMSENGIEFKNKKANEILNPDIEKTFIQAIKNTIKTNKLLKRQEIAIKSGGKEKIIGFSISHIPQEKQNLIVVIFQDITRYIKYQNSA